MELRAKSNFSFLIGASHPEELIATAVASDLKGMAITDINGVYGMPKGYKIARDHSNFNYISGAEITFKDHANLTLIAETRKAYGWICQYLTETKKDHKKGENNVAFSNFIHFANTHPPENLAVLPRLNQEKEYPIHLKELKELFDQKLYLPLTFYLDGHDQKRVKTLREWQKKYDLEFVASNDVEYHVKARKILQDVLISIREGKPLNEIGFKLRSNAERYIKSPRQINILYKDFQEAIYNSFKIAEGCTFSPGELKYRYPSEWIPQLHCPVPLKWTDMTRPNPTQMDWV